MRHAAVEADKMLAASNLGLLSPILPAQVEAAIRFNRAVEGLEPLADQVQLAAAMGPPPAEDDTIEMPAEAHTAAAPDVNGHVVLDDDEPEIEEVATHA